MRNKGSISSRERVLAALNHEETDRVPIQDSPWVAAIERWRKWVEGPGETE